MALDFTGERYVPKLRGQIYYEHLHRYAIALRFVGGKRVLDIASGEGYGSNLLARAAARVIGVDVDEASIEHARKHYYAPNLHFLRGSCEQIPLDAASVDVVVSFETIEHAEDHRRMLDEIRRVLAPDGILIISSPNKLVYSDIPDNRNPFHFHEMYYSELRDELTSRFANVTIYGQRIAASSVIFPLRGEPRASAAWFSGGLKEVAQRLPELPDPVYFMALCGPHGGDESDLSSAFVDADDDLLHDMQQEVLTLRHQAGVSNGATRTAELPAISGPLSLPAGMHAGANPSEPPVSNGEPLAFEQTVHILDSLANLISVADYVLPDAANEATIAGELTRELLKVRARAAELLEAAEIGDAQRTRATTERINALESALTAERHASAALRDQIGALQTERLQLIQGHLLALRSAEHAAAERNQAEVRRLQREVAASQEHAANEIRRITAEAALKNAPSAIELEHIARERALLKAILQSNSWRLTKPLRVVLSRIRPAGGLPE